MEHTPSTHDVHGHVEQEFVGRSSVASQRSTNGNDAAEHGHQLTAEMATTHSVKSVKSNHDGAAIGGHGASDMGPTQSQESNNGAAGYGRQATSNAYVAAAEEMTRQTTEDMQSKATEEQQRHSQIEVARQATAEMQRQATVEMQRQATQDMQRRATHEMELKAAEDMRHRATTEFGQDVEELAAKDMRHRATTEFDQDTEELQTTLHNATHDAHEEPVFQVFQDPDPSTPPPKDKSARGRMSTTDTSPGTPTTAASNTSPRNSPARRQQHFASAPSPIGGHSVLNLSSFHKSPRYTFQPAFRDNNAMSVPGPGSYNQDGKLVGKKPQHVMTSRPGQAMVPKRPGPGAYEIIRDHEIGAGKKCSFGVKREKKKPQVPGPGSYAHREVVGAGSGFTVQVPRESRGAAVPGPGQYEGHSNHKVRHPQFTMTGPGSRHTANQPAADKMRSPGPGAYEIPIRFGEGKKSSHGVPKQGRVSSTPGPGHYGGAYTTFHLPHQN